MAENQLFPQLQQPVAPLQFGYSNQQAVPQMNAAIPLDAQGNAIAVNYADPALNKANQFLLQEQGGLTSNSININNAPTGMTAGNWAGLGLGAINLGFGIANKRKELGIAQGNLDLSRSKFKFLTDEKAAIKANTQADNARAAAMVNKQNG